MSLRSMIGFVSEDPVLARERLVDEELLPILSEAEARRAGYADDRVGWKGAAVGFK